MSRLCVQVCITYVFALGLCGARGVLAADEGEGASTSTKKCRLGQGGTGTISVTVTPSSCGMVQAQARTVSVKAPGGAALLTMELLDVARDDADFCPHALDPVIDVRCRDNRVDIFQRRGSPKVVVSLVSDAENAPLRLVSPLPIERGWQSPPATGRERAERLQLAYLLKAAAESPVPVIDRTLAAEMTILTARDHVAAGEWLAAEQALAGVGSGSERAAEVRGLLAAARARSVPVKVTRHQLGTTLAAQKVPLDAGAAASLFWLKGELCVIQEDDPPRAMRCYAPKAKKWGAARPIVRPADDGRALKVLENVPMAHQNCTLRDASIIVPRSVPEDKVAICGEYEGAYSDELVAVVDGGKMLVAREVEPEARRPGKIEAQEFRLDPGLEPETVDAEQAAELARSSAGSTLVGGGCCIFRHDGSLRSLSWDGQKTWDVRGDLPKDSEWIQGPPLASPDQRWAVAQSHTLGGKFTLWLLEIERLRAAQPRSPGN